MPAQYISNRRAPRASNGGVGIGVDSSNLLEFRQIISGTDTTKTVVDATSTQTLTNKTLTSPTLTSATVATGMGMGAATTWSGTPTFTAIPSFIGATAGAVTAALLLGGGTTATPCATSTASKNFVAFWTKSTATSGDSRGLYLRHYFSGVGGSGEAARIFATVDNVNAASGGTVNGAHISLSITGASGAVSGQGFGARIGLGADAQTRTLNANLGVLNLDSDIATGNTVPAGVGFIRITDTAAVRINTLFRLPNAANGTLLAAHTDQAMTHSIKCVTDDGTVYYLMATTTSTGRS